MKQINASALLHLPCSRLPPGGIFDEALWSKPASSGTSNSCTVLLLFCWRDLWHLCLPIAEFSVKCTTLQYDHVVMEIVHCHSTITQWDQTLFVWCKCQCQDFTLGCYDAWLFVALEYCGHATPAMELCLCETNTFVTVTFYIHIHTYIYLYYRLCIAFWNQPVFQMRTVFFSMKILFFCKIK